VELEELARVVLVQAAAPAAQAHGRGRGDPVVEVDEHRGAAGDGEQQVLEAPEGVGHEDLALVVGQEEAQEALAREDAEVARPEVEHRLPQPEATVHGPHQARAGHLGCDLSRPSPELAPHRARLGSILLAAGDLRS
jgi:hypothetical protein